MKVNFDTTEYALLVDLADAAATTPAVLVHDWTMQTAAERWQQLKDYGAGGGSGDGDGETGPPPPPPSQRTRHHDEAS